MTDIGVFEEMLKLGRDNALLRFTLGSAFYKRERFEESCMHLHKALEFSPDYTAAWKMLGRSLMGCEQFEAAVEAFESGLKVANSKGDKQAEKEMKVFLSRAIKKCE